MTRTEVLLLGILPIVLLVGCSSIPEPRDPASGLAGPAEPLPHLLCLAPIRVSVSEEEDAKGHDLAHLADPGKIALETRRWIAASGAFAGVRVADAESGDLALAEAWEQREDLLLEVSLHHLSTPYEGHNGWWGPNLALWGLAMVPAWFVATEEYALTFTVRWTLKSVDSGLILAEGERAARVAATLDELDRGWQPLGFLQPDNDAEDWRTIAELLLDAGRAEAAATVTEELLTSYVPHAGDRDTNTRMRKTTALVVGVSEYRNPLLAPPLTYAASDARAVALAVEDRLGIHEQHLGLLLDRDATKEKVVRALSDLSMRTRRGDQLVVYFAGYGSRNADGEPVLLTSEADQNGTGTLSLGEIASVLRGVEGEILILLDCSFDGLGRSIRSDAPRPGEGGGDLAILSSVGTVLQATTAGDHLVTPEQIRASLFAFHLLRALRGEADREPDGVVTAGELFALVYENVVADAAFVGKRQRPLAAGLDRAVGLRLMPAAGRAEEDGGTEP